MAPFMPTKAQQLWEMLGKTDEVASQPWPGLPQAGTWRGLDAGAALGTPEALFPRVQLPESEA